MHELSWLLIGRYGAEVTNDSSRPEADGLLDVDNISTVVEARIQSYLFASSNELIATASLSIDTLMAATCAELFSVTLASDEELELLMGLLGIEPLRSISLRPNTEFLALFDYSDKFLPQMNQEDFDVFYEKWLRLTHRDSNMDEYGQLLFLQGRAASWNQMASRFILREAPMTSAE
ncbi:hypothetical protein [Janthinobacterium sp. 13]|uniref:hypothetical protein n=1 Tax=Janthinobacterium sp. 13 TaxID=2035211 RepID=UPI001179B269|nr:hypothetical protein [Janthinobacterium sp. 13]